jgi:hypothetical protein
VPRHCWWHILIKENIDESKWIKNQRYMKTTLCAIVVKICFYLRLFRSFYYVLISYLSYLFCRQTSCRNI